MSKHDLDCHVVRFNQQHFPLPRALVQGGQLQQILTSVPGWPRPSTGIELRRMDPPYTTLECHRHSTHLHTVRGRVFHCPLCRQQQRRNVNAAFQLTRTLCACKLGAAT